MKLLLESNGSTDPVGNLLLPAVQSPRRKQVGAPGWEDLVATEEVEKDRAVGSLLRSPQLRKFEVGFAS